MSTAVEQPSAIRMSAIDGPCPEFSYRSLEFFNAPIRGPDDLPLPNFNVEFSMRGGDQEEASSFVCQTKLDVDKPIIHHGKWISLTWNGTVRYGWVDTIEIDSLGSSQFLFLGIKVSVGETDGRLVMMVRYGSCVFDWSAMRWCKAAHMTRYNNGDWLFDEKCHLYPAEVWLCPRFAKPNPKVCHWACLLGYHPDIHPAFERGYVDALRDVHTPSQMLDDGYKVFGKYGMTREQYIEYVNSDCFRAFIAEFTRPGGMDKEYTVVDGKLSVVSRE
ncbi:hypothetical protein PsYK624_173240 [Phanerochaete sordida]|uniref:Uncharacterized protein n=1 Tax=Phanerochaete sordida TaxID=48140 RepID=A0A9P3GSY9_9APHY|nr:hypothetical protein PsYK624_173240 [Phanerochaete sordida]